MVLERGNGVSIGGSGVPGWMAVRDPELMVLILLDSALLEGAWVIWHEATGKDVEKRVVKFRSEVLA